MTEAAAAHAAQLEATRRDLDHQVASLSQTLRTKQAELDAARGGDEEKIAAAAAQEEAIALARADAEKHALASATATTELQSVTARQLELESELTEIKSQSAAAAAAAAESSAEAEAELRRKLSEAHTVAERTKLQLEALQAAAGADTEGTFSELAEWEAVLAVEALLQKLEAQGKPPSEEAVTAAAVEGGFSDFGSFLSALKTYDCEPAASPALAIARVSCALCCRQRGHSCCATPALTLLPFALPVGSVSAFKRLASSAVVQTVAETYRASCETIGAHAERLLVV